MIFDDPKAYQPIRISFVIQYEGSLKCTVHLRLPFLWQKKQSIKQFYITERVCIVG